MNLTVPSAYIIRVMQQAQSIFQCGWYPLCTRDFFQLCWWLCSSNSWPYELL